MKWKGLEMCTYDRWMGAWMGGWVDIEVYENNPVMIYIGNRVNAALIPDNLDNGLYNTGMWLYQT